MTMTCDGVQGRLHDFVKRRLEPAEEEEVRAHLAACRTCTAGAEAEHALDELLEQRLPRYEAPTALRRRLALLAGRGGAAPRPARRWSRLVAPAMAAGLALLTIGVVLRGRGAGGEGELARLGSEAVNDHLRVLASQHPVDVESGGSHQVKPWFEGKLDFAPEVPALEGSGVQLRGGAVGYVYDRKAAVLVYQLRLHLVTLLVFRAEGLAWPQGGGRQLGPARVQEASIRGFNAFLWRDDGLGYALVSDVNAKELSELAARVVAETVRAPAR